MEDIFNGLELNDDIKGTLNERLENAKQSWIDGAKNDPDFVKQIRTEEAGKFFNSIEKVLKRNLGVSPDDIDEDVTGLKRQEALLKLGLSALEKNKDKTNQELQDELLKVKAAKKELEDERIPELLQQERQKHYQRYISEAIMKDTLNFETTCNERARVSIVNSFLQDNSLRAEWDNEDGQYRILTKDNLKYTKNDRPLTNREIVELALDDGGVLKKSNGTPAETTTAKVNEPLNRKPGKLSSNAEAMLASFQSGRR